MKPSISTKFVSAAALAVAALGTASAAHARSDVYFSVGVQGPPVYMEPAPVYVQPEPVYVQTRPMYVQPRPMYLQPPVYTNPVEVYGARPCPPSYDASYEEERAWRRAEWRRRHWRQHHDYWDQHQSRSRNWDD